MKYWWLEKYKNFKIIQIKDLIKDINYFLTMPKNYEKTYNILKNENIENLEEEELLILLNTIVTTKNVKDNKLSLIIKKLLTIPDNSFPKSDYSLEETLVEISKLKTNLPHQEKLEINNISICYNCLNVYYVDKIKNVNKKNLCLCPFCLKSKLYFDNDYIPMNYTFIKLASIYYKTSSLGCTFREIKKMLKKNIKLETDIKNYDIDLTEIFPSKVKPIDEKIISKKIYDLLMKKEENLDHEVTLYTKELNDFKMLILLVSIMEVLSNSIYLKDIIIVSPNKKVITELKQTIKTIISN